MSSSREPPWAEEGPGRPPDLQTEPPLEAAVSTGAASNGRARWPDRLGALIEVVLCSDFPTQLLIFQVLALAGVGPLDEEGHLTLGYVSTLLLLDAVVLTALILIFLALHGERPRDLFFGRGIVRREALLGLLLIPVILGFVFGALGLIQRVVPSLHNVTQNPLEGLIRTRKDALVFGVVAIVAGGLREEIQRAFILRRFERYLGGTTLGLALFSVAFGAGHVVQGWDAAITTGLLGIIWGIIYLRRRSIVAPVISHSGFNIAEIVRLALGA